MKQFLKYQFVIFIILTVGITSCSKKDDPAESDIPALITANKWKVIERANDDNRNGKIDEKEFKLVPDNEKSTITFLPTGLGNQTMGTMFNATFQWNLDDKNNIKLLYNVTNIVSTWQIEKLTDKELNILGSDGPGTVIYAFHCQVN